MNPEIAKIVAKKGGDMLQVSVEHTVMNPIDCTLGGWETPWETLGRAGSKSRMTPPVNENDTMSSSVQSPHARAK